MAVALAATLVMALVATDGLEITPYTDVPWPVAVSDTQLHLTSGNVGQILDYAASALLPGYAFAHTVNEFDLTAAGSITDGDADTVLDGVNDVVVYESDGSWYAVVAAYNGDAVHILDITDPYSITSVGNIINNNTTKLASVLNIAVYESDGSRYAAVTAYDDTSVQILNITDPDSITAADSITDNNINRLLGGAQDIAVYESDGSWYAAVTSDDDSGVQILDVTDPDSITAAGNIADNSTLTLSGAQDIAVYESDDKWYAVVAAYFEAGVQILDITNPGNITAADSITDSTALELGGAWGVAVFESDDNRYAAVTAIDDDGVQILDITDPTDITPAGSIDDTDYTGLKLGGADGIVVFESDGNRYAAVTAVSDHGVQILDITDPTDITPAGSIDDDDTSKLDTPRGIDVFELRGSHYAAVAAYEDNSVQLIKMDRHPPAEAFVTTWGITTASDRINIPLEVHAGEPVTIDWGDGSTPEELTVDGVASHQYPASGEYRIIMTGGLSRINLGEADGLAPLLLQSIDQWGDIRWSTMENAFRGAIVMQYKATDVPNLSGVASMENMFREASRFNGNLTDWNVSKVTDMSGMFFQAGRFNQTLNSWNIASVTDMSAMFADADAFNQPLNDWDVVSVTDMSEMFADADAFNQPLNDWDVVSVTDMSVMFSEAFTFNQTLNGWNVESVTDMSSMFSGAFAFNQNISSWDVSSVTNMGSMFGSTSFNQPLNDWDVSSVTNMGNMFAFNVLFNQPLDEWDVSSATSMRGMFIDTFAFDQNLGTWYIVPADYSYNTAEASRNVTTISAQNSVLDGHSPIYDIGIGHDSEFFTMEGNTLLFNIDPPAGSYQVNVIASGSDFFEIDTIERVLDVTVTGEGGTLQRPFITTWEMIADGESVRIPVEVYPSGMLTINWGDGSASETFSSDGTVSHQYAVAGEYPVSMVGDLSRINLGTSDSTVLKLVSIDQWGDIEWSTMSGAFQGAYTMEYKADDVPDLSGVGSMRYMFSSTEFNSDISSWNVSSVRDMSRMFEGAASFNQPLNNWDVSAVTTMSNMFSSAASFNQPLNLWNVSSVTNMNGMFHFADVFNRPLNDWDVSSVRDMSLMFRGADRFNQDLNDWSVSSVTGMSSMFDDADSFNGNISSWDVSAVENMQAMFHAVPPFDGDLSGWVVSKVTDMSSMFHDANSFDADLSGWDVSKVTNMTSTFQDATSFDADLSGWTVSAVEDMRSMFQDATSFDADLSGWDVSAVEDMRSMFQDATSFDADLSGWTVSAVEDMRSMFLRATSFNGNISGWDVSGVTDMSSMFGNADSFNQDLNDWVVSSVTDMQFMFSDTALFNGDISRWDVSNVLNMNSMFSYTDAFNVDISNWDVSSVEFAKMRSIFLSAQNFTQNLGKWHITLDSTSIDLADSSITIGTIKPQNDDLATENAPYGIGANFDSDKFMISGNNLNIKTGQDYTLKTSYMVNITSDHSFGVNNHRIVDVTVTNSTGTLLSADAGSDLRVLDGSNVALSGAGSGPGDLTYLWTQSRGPPAVAFAGAATLMPTFTAPDVSSDSDLEFRLRVSNVTHSVTDTVTVTVHNAEADFVTTWDSPSMNLNIPIRASAGSFTVDWGDGMVTEYFAANSNSAILHRYTEPGPYTVSISGDFSGIHLDGSAVALRLQSIDQWGDIEWTTMNGAFKDAVNMVYRATDTPDLSSVTDMHNMFSRTTNFSGGDLSGWDVSGVTDMNNMFFSSGYDGDLSGWDVSGVTDMTSMFRNAFSFNADISNWDVSSVEFMNNMFTGATLFDQNLGKWYVVLDNASIARTDAPVLVGKISAQNLHLDSHNPEYEIVTGGDSGFFDIVNGNELHMILNATKSAYRINMTASGGAVFEDGNNWHTLRITVNDASNRKSSSNAPAVDLGTLAYQRLADIPQHIAEQIALHGDSDPLEPLVLDGAFEFPLAINGYGYLLYDTTGTLVPQTVTAGDDPATITFTVYTEKDLAHFTLYLNLQDGNTDYADSDTYITYKGDGTTVVTDPHGYIADATITVTQEDDQVPEKKTVSITIHFAEPMGLTNAVAYMWNTDRKATFIRVIDALEVAAAPPQEPVVQAADPEPVEPDPDLPADPEPVLPDMMMESGDYDEAQILNIIRMWSGFEPEMITDEQLLDLLGLYDDYPDADIPDWVMTELGVLVAKGSVTVDEFVLALQYVLENP